LQRGGRPSARDRILASRTGCGAIEAIMQGQRNVMIGVSFFREFAAAEHVPARSGVNDDWQMNHYGMISHLGDMPFIRILDMTPQYLFHIDVLLSRYLQRCQREEQHRHQEELLEMFHIL
jgi:hypothetical protein